jgi:hypothetical protein
MRRQDVGRGQHGNNLRACAVHSLTYCCDVHCGVHCPPGLRRCISIMFTVVVNAAMSSVPLEMASRHSGAVLKGTGRAKTSKVSGKKLQHRNPSSPLLDMYRCLISDHRVPHAASWSSSTTFPAPIADVSTNPLLFRHRQRAVQLLLPTPFPPSHFSPSSSALAREDPPRTISNAPGRC